MDIREKCDYLRRTSRSNWSAGNNETATGKRHKSVRPVASRPGKTDSKFAPELFPVNPDRMFNLNKKKKSKKLLNVYILSFPRNENLYLYFREKYNLAF